MFGSHREVLMLHFPFPVFKIFSRCGDFVPKSGNRFGFLIFILKAQACEALTSYDYDFLFISSPAHAIYLYFNTWAFRLQMKTARSAAHF